MHDIVIRGGTIIDGTGRAAFAGDVAIAGKRIAAVGGRQGPGRREIDATGLLVTPGWVDVHTHYDGQAMWDPLLAPSCWHGVTTVMFGNCGVGFAPVKKHHRGALMDLMEGVEEIPNPVLAAGLTWEWETFPEFMDALNPFTVRPSYKQLESLPIAEQRRRLRDPQVRRKILAEKPSEAEVAKLAQFRQAITRRWDKFFVMGNPPDYEPGPEKSVDAIATREGRSPDEVAYDYIIEDGHYLYFPVVNYVTGDHAPIHEMMNDPACLLGLSDGGAHCTSIVDAGMPSYMLAHWGRDRQRGPKLPLEMLVKRQTSETAEFFGLRDRGRLAPGLRADVNLIDFSRLRLYQPELVNDMPAGGRRFVQRVDGYEATLVAGTPVFEHGEHTGAMPGRLVRAGRMDA